MKKLLSIILFSVGLFALSAIAAFVPAGENNSSGGGSQSGTSVVFPEKSATAIGFKDDELVITFGENERISYGLGDIVEILTRKEASSSHIEVLRDKEDIKNCFGLLFNSDTGFYDLTEEEINLSAEFFIKTNVSVLIAGGRIEIYLLKDEKKMFLNLGEKYYSATTADLDELYDTYIKR